LRNLLIAGLASFFAVQVLFHAFDLRAVDGDVDVFLKRTINYFDSGQPLDQGNLVGYGFRLGSFANYWSLLPLRISRDLRAQYYFVTLLDIFALALIFFALRQLFGDGPGQWFAAAAFAFHFLMTPFAAQHNYYLPFFLAIYFCFLALSARDRTWTIAPAWLFLGIAMQIHMSAVLLIVPTMIVTRFWRDRATLLLTLLGVAALAAVNVSLIEQAAARLAPAGAYVSENDDLLRGARGALRALPFSALPIIVMTILLGGLGVNLYGALSLLQIGRWLRTLRTDRHVIIGGASALFLAYAVMLPLHLIRYQTTAWTFEPTHYFFPAAPFLCYFAGLFFQYAKWSPPYRNWRENGPFHAKIFAALTGVTTVAILISAAAVRLFPCYKVNVDNQVAVYHHVAAVVAQHRLAGFRFSQCNRFWPGETPPSIWDQGKPGIYYYAEPGLRAADFGATRNLMVVVVDSKAGLALWAVFSAHKLTGWLSREIGRFRRNFADCGVPPHARLVDRFETRDMQASIYFDFGGRAPE
jgi:hypothetical protein